MKHAHGELSMDPRMSMLSLADQSIVLTGFILARQHVSMFVQHKLGHWQQLPQILAGLGHADLVLA
eukprot:5609975-Alexandrium_andersonii.AAC.1